MFRYTVNQGFMEHSVRGPPRYRTHSCTPNHAVYARYLKVERVDCKKLGESGYMAGEGLSSINSIPVLSYYVPTTYPPPTFLG
jgi:hypothetical protein